MSAYSKNSGFFSGKGFYVALALCLAGAGTAAYLAAGTPREAAQESPPQAQTQELLPAREAETPASNVPVEPEEAYGPTRGGDEEALAALNEPLSEAEAPVSAPAPVTKQASAFSLPVAGEVLAEYSGKTLVQNVTLGDWRTHNGVDLRAEEGQNVLAAADGVVQSVALDPLWGTVITIDHGDGLVSATCCLTQNVTVKPGDGVRRGEVIGEVGAAPAESLLPSHIHFEMKRDGGHVSPLDEMGLR